jgi:hypothetical protein
MEPVPYLPLLPPPAFAPCSRPAAAPLIACPEGSPDAPPHVGAARRRAHGEGFTHAGQLVQNNSRDQSLKPRTGRRFERALHSMFAGRMLGAAHVQRARFERGFYSKNAINQRSAAPLARLMDGWTDTVLHRAPKPTPNRSQTVA